MYDGICSLQTEKNFLDSWMEWFYSLKVITKDFARIMNVDHTYVESLRSIRVLFRSFISFFFLVM